MYKRMCIMICFLVMAVPGSLLAQLQVDGEWELDKVHIRLYSHQSNKLLEEITSDTLPPQVKLVGREVIFQGGRYEMQVRHGISQGTYLLLSDGRLSFREHNRPAVQVEGQPEADIFCTITMPETNRLYIALPEDVYRSHAHGVIVKQLFICQYKRKK